VNIYIIAEAGVNHNGDSYLAKTMVDVAAEAGADAIKFQTFSAREVVSKYAVKAEYQQKNDDRDKTQAEMLSRLELSPKQHEDIIAHCAKRHITFLSTPFDFVSIELLCSLNIPIMKIPSGEITNLPYLIKIARTGKPIVISSGMSTLDELRAAIEALKANGAGEITALHCTTEYPAPFEDVNLRAMLTIGQELGVKVGYSDHTPGIEISIAAAALGASVIEKHFTLDRNMEGPDHKASLEPNELKAMVKAIRNVEKSLGNTEKIPSPSEHKNILIVRKSIVAKCDISKGEVFSEENITVKRPGSGISPMRWLDVLGTHAVKDFHEDEMITL